MSDYNLGTAHGVIEIEYKGDGPAQASRDLSLTGKQAQTAGDHINKASNMAAKGGAVIAGGFALAVRSAANFEQRLSAISAVSGATQSEMDAVRDKALQLGKDTAFSASESAEAMEELIKAGLSVDDVLNGAADATVALAAAGAVDMPTAATIASNAMNQFNLTAKDMVGVVDNIAGAANASAIDVGEFGMSLSQVGAVANLAGVSFDDTATAIALMGNAGIKGSDAGTSLKTMLQNLQPVTDKQKELFRELGIVTKDGTNRFYDAEGQLKSLDKVSGILNKSLSGMTDQQKQLALETIFGSDAIRAAAVLTDEGAAGFRKMSEEMNKVSAADVAKKRLDNFKGSLEQFKGSLETAGIGIGTILLPALKTLVDGLNELLGGFLALPEGVQKGIVIFGVAAGALLLVVAAVGKMIIFANELKLALAGLRLAFAGTWIAALGPVALIIAAVLAVVAVIVILWKKSETFRDIVLGVWDAIKSSAKAVADFFTSTLPAAFSRAWGAISGGLSAVASFFSSVWDGIKSAVSAAFGFVLGLIIGYVTMWKNIIMGGVNAILAVWRAVWGLFGPAISAVFGLIVAILNLVWTVIKGIFLIQLNAVKAVWNAAWGAIVASFRAVWGVIRAVVGAGVRFVLGIVRAVWGAIRGATVATWNAIVGVLRGVWNRIVAVVSGPLGRIRSFISGAWNAVKTMTSSAWNAVVRVVGDKISSMLGKIRAIGGRIKSALGNTGTLLYNAGKEIIEGLVRGIAAVAHKATDKVKQITGGIKKLLPGSPVKEGPLRVLNRGYAGKQIVKMVIDGMDSMSTPLKQTVEQMLSLEAFTPDMAAVNSALSVPNTVGSQVPSFGPSVAFPAGMKLGGELTLVNGKAYISSIALETVDNENAMAATHSRMGGN